MSPGQLAAGIALFALAAAWPVMAQDEAPASFSQAQADHGAELYRDNCAMCHGPHLNDGEFGPSLNGARFKRQWAGNGAGGLFAYLRAAMPPTRTSVLKSDEYADLMAFLFQANGAKAGDKPLPDTAEALSALTVPK